MPKTLCIEIPESLMQPLVVLLDAGLRASGLRAARDAALIAAAIDQAAMRVQASGAAIIERPNGAEADRATSAD